uniref:Uncharacterized protein n=1 Tax=Anopheles coluzzii TaxID=1518534 RepID=A0A8W7PIC8_ANOCL
MFYCRRPAVKLTCLPHFQSGPRMTRDPTPSIVKREGRAAAATFVGPAGPTSSMLAVDEVLAQAIVSRVHWNLVSSGRNNNLRDGFCHHYYRLLGPVDDRSPAPLPLFPAVPGSGELAVAEQLGCTGTVLVAIALSRSRSRPGRNASSRASTRASVGAHRAYPAAFCNQTTIVPTMLLKFTSDLQKLASISSSQYGGFTWNEPDTGLKSRNEPRDPKNESVSPNAEQYWRK